MYKGEKINSISHLVGASLSLVGWILLIIFSSLTGDPWKIVGCTIYGFSLFFMYLFSTLYHSFKGRAKTVFQIFDHIAIYILIAGTYTPITLVTLRGKMGWIIFGLVWGIALVGTIFKTVWTGKSDRISTAFYVLAGWTILLDITELYEKFPRDGFYWIFAGGVLYTVGAFFYLKDSMRRNHEIWHFFVLFASICHYVAIFFYLI
ncbi:MAG: hemolysin III family protein [Leptospiraceae bacterium]|nr:hemolysin III family protein [Leptospiraceae bacterium]